MFQLGSRAVHWACRGGSLDVVKALKSHGADLNVRDKVNAPEFELPCASVNTQ